MIPLRSGLGRAREEAHELSSNIFQEITGTLVGVNFLEFNALLQNRPLFQAICPGSLWARDNRCTHYSSEEAIYRNMHN